MVMIEVQAEFTVNFPEDQWEHITGDPQPKAWTGQIYDSLREFMLLLIEDGSVDPEVTVRVYDDHGQ